jgi:hypothetical protein
MAAPLRNRPIRNKNCLWRPCLLRDRNEMSNLCRGPSIDASYQVSVYLTKRFQRRRFLEIDQSETIIACHAISTKSSSLKPLSQMNQNLVRSIIGMSSIKIANFVLIRLQTWLRQAIIVSDRRRFCRNRPIRNKNCMWRPCLLTNRDEMSIHYRGPSIDASYQVSVYLTKRFQRRRFLEIRASTKIAHFVPIP